MRVRHLLASLLAVALGLGGLALAATLDIRGIPYAHENLTVADQGLNITSTLCRVGGVAAGTPTAALVEVRTNGIYYRIDTRTATPTSTAHYLATGEMIRIEDASQFRAVRAVSGNASVAVTCLQ